jgi:hypothetical protein
MKIGYPEPLSPEDILAIKGRGGFCHRAPWNAPTGVQSAISQEMNLLVLNGFGLCQKDLCPMWYAETKVCLERLAALRAAGLDGLASEERRPKA